MGRENNMSVDITEIKEMWIVGAALKNAVVRVVIGALSPL